MSVKAVGNGSEALPLTVGDAAAVLRISSNLAYELVAQGRLPHVRLGRRVFIPRSGFEQWIAREAGLLEPPPLPIGEAAKGKRHVWRTMGKPAAGKRMN